MNTRSRSTHKTFVLLPLAACLLTLSALPAMGADSPAAKTKPKPLASGTLVGTANPQAIVLEQTLLAWHGAALTATGLDHTPPGPGESRAFAEQLGPLRASRAMAIVHIAIVDALLSVTGGYASYTGLQPPAPLPSGATLSLNAALGQAAHDALVAMFPAQAAGFDQRLAQQMANSREPLDALAAGQAQGRAAAAAILQRRAADGSAHAEPRYGVEYLPSTLPGQWRQDPVSRLPIALGARWAQVTPFVLRSASQFRLPPPPALDSAAFAKAYAEAQQLGGDGITTATSRSQADSLTGLYWAYDGTPTLCAPPRLYNQLAVAVDAQNPRFHSNDWIVFRSPQWEGYRRVVDITRYLALINIAMADAGIAAWDSKYHHNLGRPVTVIREGLPGTALVADPAFTPLGAPASNLAAPNFTPPFPAYPSGHATFGGALFQIMRRMKGGDYNAFSFVSDELDGHTRANDGTVRAYLPRSYSHFTRAEKENGRSRVYLGIHWDFDASSGIQLGNQVADHVYANTLRPLPSLK